MQFCHIEFPGALAAVLKKQLLLTEDDIRNQLDNDDFTFLSFTNALNYSGTAAMPAAKLCRFNNAMQYLHVMKTDDGDGIPRRAIVQATERCSLVHAIYEVVGEAESYSNLASVALENNGFINMMSGHENDKATWCVRVCHYGEYSDSKKERRFGSRTRSVTMEREALSALAPLFRTFGGGVNLREPDCKIYVFDGLGDGKKVLARQMASGPQVSIIAPRTRICETNMPLCPIAAFLLCNVAGVQPHFRILDPFAGSCSTLLAAAMIERYCQTVGIEIAHNGLVNREAIHDDFRTRHLVEPVALIHGDSTDNQVRAQAREAIGNEAFDLIIMDLPYGIRESKLEMTPIEELLKSLSKDRDSGWDTFAEARREARMLPSLSGQRGVYRYYADRGDDERIWVVM